MQLAKKALKTLRCSFNNYVDKKGGGGVSKKSTLVHPGRGGGAPGCPRGQKFEKKV